uniref:Uncharacterized protein n=1 Tax=Onchocerca volvulus TaxID=6282 RepID=A0A8R1XQR7_ONCVO
MDQYCNSVQTSIVLQQCAIRTDTCTARSCTSRSNSWYRTRALFAANASQSNSNIDPMNTTKFTQLERGPILD